MAMDCSKLPYSVEMNNTNKATKATARLTLIVTTAVGTYFVSRAVVGTECSLSLLVVIMLTVALSGLTADVKRHSGSTPLSIPLSHVGLFTGALTLGPSAALAGVFGGISSIIFRPSQQRSLLDIFYIIFKPAAVCATTAAVYAAAGGQVTQPHSVDSVTPAILSGIVYIVGHALLTLGIQDYRSEPKNMPNGVAVAAGWSLCLLAGYSVAVLHTIAPLYVMAAPVMAGLVMLAATKTPQQPKEEAVEVVDETLVQKMAEPEAITPSVFVDELTGLASHRYLMMFLDREVSRSLRTDSPLAVAAFDIDGFSKLNNPNALLVELGRRLKQGLREYDLVARHSSGRIVVVLPDTTLDSALDVCKRLHVNTSSLDADDKPVSVSVGIAMLPDNATSSESLINASHYAINRGRFSGEGGVHVCERLDKAG